MHCHRFTLTTRASQNRIQFGDTPKTSRTAHSGRSPINQHTAVRSAEPAMRCDSKISDGACSQFAVRVDNGILANISLRAKRAFGENRSLVRFDLFPFELGIFSKLRRGGAPVRELPTADTRNVQPCNTPLIRSARSRKQSKLSAGNFPEMQLAQTHSIGMRLCLRCSSIQSFCCQPILAKTCPIIRHLFDECRP